MTDATRMDCLSDPCPSPTACNARGSCKVREADKWASWWQAFEACRDLGIADPFSTKTREGEW